MPSDAQYMRFCLSLAKRGYGATSPNPMVGSVLVKGRHILGRGWHHAAGQPHAEIEALHDAQRRRHDTRGATLYVTLEPCCTHGRTPPCTEAIINAGIRRVVVGTVDPNPRHAGGGLVVLRKAGIKVEKGVLEEECKALNESFNHWIVHRRPFVIVKAAMTLDGKIATASGESKWITGKAARAYGMKLRQAADAILIGINTVLADDPSLTFRPLGKHPAKAKKHLRRIVLDANARTPLTAKVVADDHPELTTIVVHQDAPQKRVQGLSKKVQVIIAPGQNGRINLRWLSKKLGSQNVTNLLVEGGGEVNASFLVGKLVHRVAFFYAPKILGGADAKKAVSGVGATSLKDAFDLTDVQWRRVGRDWLLLASVASKRKIRIKP